MIVRSSSLGDHCPCRFPAQGWCWLLSSPPVGLAFVAWEWLTTVFKLNWKTAFSFLSPRNSRPGFSIHNKLVEQYVCLLWPREWFFPSTEMDSFPTALVCLLLWTPDAFSHWYQDASRRKPLGFPHHAHTAALHSLAPVLCRSSLRSCRRLYKSQLEQLRHSYVREATFYSWDVFTGWNTDFSATLGLLLGSFWIPPVFPGQTSVMASFRQCLSDVSLWVPTLFPMGQWTPQEQEASLIHVCVSRARRSSVSVS